MLSVWRIRILWKQCVHVTAYKSVINMEIIAKHVGVNIMYRKNIVLYNF